MPKYEAASAQIDSTMRRWLVDSGCPIDLIASDELTDEEKQYIKKLTRGIRLQTANGLTNS